MPTHGSLFDHVRNYQNACDVSDDDMIRILCDVIECAAEEAMNEDILSCIKNHLPLSDGQVPNF